YRNAMRIVAVTQQIFFNTYQARYDALPFVMGGGHLELQQQLKEVISTSPTLATLFGSVELCDCEHCQSLYGPTAYFVELLRFLESISGNTPLQVLLGRRPDLAHIRLNCDNAMTPMPYVDLVNEILEYAVAYGELKPAAAKNTDRVSADDLKANPQHSIPHAYAKLKEASYPITLPFDRDVETVRVYLEHLGSSRHEVMDLFRKNDRAATKCAVAAERLKITAEEYRILTGMTFAEATPNPGFIKIAYKLFGYDMVNITREIEMIPVTRPWWKWPVKVAGFLKVTGLSYIELIEIIKTQFINPDQESNKTIILYAPSESSCDLDATHIQHPDGSGLDAPTQVKINQFIRLWRKLGWSIPELDKAATAFQATDITAEFLQQLSWIQRLQEVLRAPLVELLSLWAIIDTHGDDSLYAKLFLNKAARDIDDAFKPSPNGSLLSNINEEISGHESTLLAAFRISAADLELIQNDAGLVHKFGILTLEAKLTLDNVSLLYRYVVLAKAMRLKVGDLIDLIALSGHKPFTTPHSTFEFVTLVNKVSASIFDLTQLNYLYRHLLEPHTGLAPQRDNLLLLAMRLRADLIRITEENTLISDSNGDFTREKLAMLFEADIAERVVEMVLDTVSTNRTKLDKLPVGIKFTNEFIRRISYDSSLQELRFTGLMTQAERNDLLLLSGDADYHTAIQKIYQECDEFIKHSTLFIENALTGFLDFSDAVNHLLNTAVKDESGEIVVDAGGVARKFSYILEQQDATNTTNGLLPYLRNQLSRSLIIETLSEAMQFESSTAELLLETILESSSESHEAAINDVIALQTPGLTAAFFSNNDLSGTPDAVQVLPVIAFDGNNTQVSARTRSLSFQGMLDVPNSEDYIFYVRSDSPVQLWVDDSKLDLSAAVGDEGSSKPISLKTGQLYNIRLEITQIDTVHPLIELGWSSATTPKDIVPSSYLYPKSIFEYFSSTYALLHKAGLLINGFEFTTEEIAYLSEHSKGFDDFNLQQLPLERTNNKADIEKAFLQWQRLYDYAALRNSLPKAQYGLIDVFGFAAAGADPLTLSEEVIEKLMAVENIDHDQWVTLSPRQVLNRFIAVVTHWNIAELDALTDEFSLTVKDFKDEKTLTRLQACMQLVKRTGISAINLVDWARSEPSPNQAQEIKDTVKAKYGDEAWITVVKPLNDRLRERQKTALINYLLAQKKFRNQGIENSNQLFEYFLIDVEMRACMMTSRLKQAIASVQLFVQRCLMNLEPEVAPDHLDDEQWEWMRRYRVWEANRKVFLYPENWIEPELRDDKSPFFKELESELLQNDLTPEYVETLFLNYLNKLDEVAHLEICGMYWEGEQDGRDHGDGILHVFGRTRNQPHRYFYRRWNEGEHGSGLWSPWEPMNLNIESDPVDGGVHLIPVVFNRRLYLFWPVFTEKPFEGFPQNESNDPPAADFFKKPDPEVHTGYLENKDRPYSWPKRPQEHCWEIQIFWTEYRHSKWATVQVSSDILVSPPHDQTTSRNGYEQELLNRKDKDAEYDIRTWYEYLTATSTLFTPKPIQHYFTVSMAQQHLSINCYRDYSGEAKVVNTVRKWAHKIVFDGSSKKVEETYEELGDVENEYSLNVHNESALGSMLFDSFKGELFIRSGLSKNKNNDELNHAQQETSQCINTYMYHSVKDNPCKFNLVGADLNLQEVFAASTNWKAHLPHQRPVAAQANASLYPFFFSAGDETFLGRPIVENVFLPAAPEKVAIPPLYEHFIQIPKGKVGPDIVVDPINEQSIFEHPAAMLIGGITQPVTGATAYVHRASANAVSTGATFSRNRYYLLQLRQSNRLVDNRSFNWTT
ncbi:MAG: hypothetical protein JRC86_02915, partial [Deltaproteobacteria bacterium]|nr:hypothetical protein [Deltaproteobacteria bacterium]